MAEIDIKDLTVGRLYTNIKRKLQKWYNVAGSTFDLASPFGMIFTTVFDLFKLNKLNVANAKRVYDLSDPFNDNNKSIRSLARLGQYNPQRGVAASGAIRLKLKPGVDAVDETNGNFLIFKDGMKISNSNNGLEYSIELSSDSRSYSLLAKSDIVLNVVQGTYKEISFTGTGEINQSYVVPFVQGREIDNRDYEVYVNSELWQRKDHKHDLLENEKAYVVYTSFSGGVDILFGNGNEGLIPGLGAKIEIIYLVHDGTDGNIADYTLNDFEFIDVPRNEKDEDVDITDIYDILIETDIKYASNGDTYQDLKDIIPYSTPNFVLSGVEQYKYYLKRLKYFSTIDVFTSTKRDGNIKTNIYKLLRKNTEILNRINETDNADSLKNIVQKNLQEVEYLRKLYISNDTENMINILLIPDVKQNFGSDKTLNYFTIDLNYFTLTDEDKTRILNYLYQDGIQTISNEVRIIDPVMKKYAVNITVQIYEKTSERDIINDIISVVSNYFVNEMRRDKIPASDLVRIIDGGVNGVDSVVVEFISDDNEKYHREYLKKSRNYFNKNNKHPQPDEIMMSDGMVYDPTKKIGLDNILGDIVFQKDEYPIIRGGFTDRYGNTYAMNPGDDKFSPINIIILPIKSKR